MKKKKSEIEKKTSPTVYEMRWAQPEDFTELKGEISCPHKYLLNYFYVMRFFFLLVMPRMMLDHFPQNIMHVLTKVLNERKNGSTLSVDCI